MPWLTDTNAVGKTMQDVDGTRGVVLEVDGDKAYIAWEDNTKSWREESYLTYVEPERM